jgi:hypothetical protein
MRRRRLLVTLLLGGLSGCFQAALEPVPDPVDAEPPDAPWPDAGVPDADPVPACAPAQSALETGHHFAGESCTGLCHDGTNGPHWTMAGTLYDNELGSHVVPGATIHLFDTVGRRVTLVTAQNGNFWTNQTFDLPVRAFASACPDLEQMDEHITSSSCNSAACHNASRRIYLPRL